ncbi:unnamed protein product, partial [Parascedosporium putredinis]
HPILYEVTGSSPDPPRIPNMATGKQLLGYCKSVLSGDTIVIGNPNNASAERNLSLAYSREFIRNLALGKPVLFTVLYTIPSTGREFGIVKIKDGPDLPDELVKEGWVKVREDAGKKESDEDILQRLENLRTLESEAKAQEKGLWSGASGVIQVQNDLGDPSFLKEWSGKTVDGIVERVFAGDRLLTRLILSDKKHLQVMTLVAGIRTPSTQRTIPSTGQVQPAEEFGNEAKAFVESRLLQRQVKVQIVGASPKASSSPRMPALRAAEKQAQGKKLRLHKNHVSKEGAGALDMIVSKVISADTIIVRNKAGDVEKRISLSSIRGPRTNEQSEAPFREEAKEFVRKRLIGKHVSMSVDGSKPATDGFEARDVATVTEKGKNIGLAVVQEGWASVIRHRKDDTDRAANYDELLAAQETAKTEKKGMWSGKPSRLSSIVDFCKSGSRFTILIPRESIKITMVLGGIRAPRAPRLPNDKGDPFGQEALDLANRRCNQRDCEIDITDIDKVGGFIGALYINRENFAKVLVEEELFAAEKKAKEARSGMWHDWDPSQEEGEEEPAPVETSSGSVDAGSKKPTDYRDVVITSIDDNGKLKLQEIGQGTAALETLMSAFKKFHLDSKNNAPSRTPPRPETMGAKIAEVVYIDYGNTEKIPWANLRPLSQPEFNTQKLKPQAVDASLFDFVDAKENISYVTLYDPKSSNELPGPLESINRDVVAGGYGMVARKLKAWERGKAFEGILKNLREVEDEAKRDRLGMWEYGDITED